MAGQGPRVTRAARESPCCSDGDRRRRSDGRPGRSIGIGDGDAAGIDYSTDHAWPAAKWSRSRKAKQW